VHPSLADLSGAFVVEGHAIVSADGAIATPEGEMPKPLQVDADWRAFQAALDRSALVVLGRFGHERHPNPGRRRLVVTGTVNRWEREDEFAVLWNPDGARLADVLEEIGVNGGTLAITGGTGVFDLFMGCYDRFVLSEVHGVVLPDGRPCFSAAHPRVVLARSGLVPSEAMEIAPDVTTTLWRPLAP